MNSLIFLNGSMRGWVFSTLILLIFPAGIFAQSLEKSANELFEKYNYQGALKGYTTLLKKDPKNVEINYKVAVCYLNTNIDRTKAIPHLETITKQDKEKYDSEAWFMLGKAYQYANRFDEAIEAYRKYTTKTKDTKEIAKAERQIETCTNGKQMVKKPVDVTFTNLGPDVNSNGADYYPWIPANESFVVFTSRRKGNVGNLIDYDGYYTSDIYISEVKTGAWIKAKNLGANINTQDDEQCVGLTSDGKTMIIYIDHQATYGDIYKAENSKGRGFDKPEPYGKTVNTSSLETAGSITSDGNILLFSSNKPDGQGGTDIYMARKLPNGDWGEPYNLGPTINTPYNEDFPHLSEDNGTLYFASEGHNSMGGYDIFKSAYDPIEKLWNKPENMGFPINNTYDNMTFCVSSTNRDGYVSALRPDGLGDLDIYKVTFNEVDERQTVLRGRILTSDTAKKELDATITITDLRNKVQLDQTFKSNRRTGKYVIALPAGVYSMLVEAEGFEPQKEEFKFYDKSDYQSEIVRDIRIYKKGEASGALPVNNTPGKSTAVPVKTINTMPQKK